MTHLFSWQRLVRALLPLLMMAGTASFAAPGAHGPNGEHLDGPAPVAGSGSTAPRFEAKSETFEMVATLRDDELSMLINRFETNEPVLDAKVEVEAGGLKAQAKFHADLGDYAVDDAAFLKAMKAPGEHAVVITVLAGADNDLLDGTLKTGNAQADAHGHAHDEGAGHGHGLSLTAWLAIALAALAALAWFLSRRPAGRQAAVTGGAR